MIVYSHDRIVKNYFIPYAKRTESGIWALPAREAGFPKILAWDADWERKQFSE